MVSETADGIRWLWRHRVLRTVCVLVGALNFAVVAVLSIAVLYALNVLHISQRAYGLLLAVLAVGGLAGVLLAPSSPGPSAAPARSNWPSHCARCRS